MSESETTRYKLGLTLLIPLGRDVFSESEPPESPLSWNRWSVYRDTANLTDEVCGSLVGELAEARVPDLTKEPKSSPWIRLPGEYRQKGQQPQPEVFLKHIEELLYPGMALLRHSVDHPSARLQPLLLDPPTRRWIGLPPADEQLHVDFSNTVMAGDFKGALELKVDAGEVFRVDLGPHPERSGFGPMIIGLLHLSLNSERFISLDGDLQRLWGAPLIRNLIWVLSQPVVELSKSALEKKDQPSGSNLRGWWPLRSSSGGGIRTEEDPEWLSSPSSDGKKFYFPSLAWLAATYFGGGLKQIAPRVLEGRHFVLQIPPSGLSDPHCKRRISHRRVYRDYGSDTESLTEELIKSAALARANEDGVATDVSSRIRAATTFRGTTLLDKGRSNSSGNQLCRVSDESFSTISSYFLRNFRSYWLQAILLSMTQHQLMKRFANQLGLTGGQLNVNRLTRQYGEWLGFRNSVWWTEIVYDRPPAEKLLRNYHEALKLGRTFRELSGDFETYTGFAEREHDKSIGRKLRNIQVLGAGIVAFGIGGVVAEISNQFNDRFWFGVLFWAIISIFITVTFAAFLFEWKRDFRDPWRNWMDRR